MPSCSTSMAPFWVLAPTPQEVRVPSSLRHAMNRLSERTSGALALVSGRPLSDLDRLFAPLHLPAVGGHGASFDPLPGAASISGARYRSMRRSSANSPRSPKADPVSSSRTRATQSPCTYRSGSRNWADVVNEAAARVCLENPSVSVELLRGKSVLEIKQAGFSKATGVRELMRYSPFRDRHPIFIGDDVTDKFGLRNHRRFPWACIFRGPHGFRHGMDISRIRSRARLARSEFQVMARLPRHESIIMGLTSPSAATAVSPHDK